MSMSSCGNLEIGDDCGSLVTGDNRRTDVSRMPDSDERLVIGDEREVDVAGIPLGQCWQVSAWLRYQIFLASNLTAAAMSARYNRA